MKPAPAYSPTVSNEGDFKLREFFREILAAARLDSRFDEEQALELLAWRTLGLLDLGPAYPGTEISHGNAL
ncbi:hypothetical protein A6M27_10380 [Acidithiobacillus thiooxidans]|uniref:Uncharacterized protein n=1 Tax=Acidithiobacillus thiooxidans TaxID=930 RepID=A0A1C2IAC8_ACITH|nr:hypothetical protein [Acidithiobacillus thiooxidans]OCX72934.1 hypothetical protein A6P07_09130 [Acidithiobacillus thiooxidans]OCX83704.1 hypothetical protein A6O26_06325 [Acidithiobacillus thiooxidans]OCX87646.1 hypothetical protein A6M27_10380 [Acidithiobacillus thiooxidans]OFC43651.1 hypothetical protein BAE47_12800 [Acidithiobacillus thiooxidans]